MREYLDRELLLAEYDRRHEGPPGGARKMIAEFPAANFTDEKEVSRARWINDGNKHTCSACGFTYYSNGKKLFRYCPECGLPMGQCSWCGSRSDEKKQEAKI